METLPLVSEFYGIRIYMYWADHMPPHFHAEYGEFSVQIHIEDAVVLKGIFPGKQLKLVLAWCEVHQDELINNWKSAERNGSIVPIEPLL